MPTLVHTVGHSIRKLDEFLTLLLQSGLTAVADVRSHPYSRVNPQFNKEPLAKFLEQNGLAYVFLGQELGARTADENCYVDGRVQYEKLARTRSFQEGLDRIEKGAQKHNIVLMCAEKEPLACHRSILISRHLVQRGIRVRHIIDSTTTEDHDASILRLLSALQMDDIRMFPRDELVELAYERQGARIAFTRDAVEEMRKRELA